MNNNNNAFNNVCYSNNNYLYNIKYPYNFINNFCDNNYLTCNDVNNNVNNSITGISNINSIKNYNNFNIQFGQDFSNKIPYYNYPNLNLVNKNEVNKFVSKNTQPNNINTLKNNNENIDNNNINNNQNNINSINEINDISTENISNINDYKMKDVNEFINYIKSIKLPLVAFLCTFEGSKEMINILNNSLYDCKIILLNSLTKKDLSKIMKNTIGNYFMQKTINTLKENEIKYILESIKQYFHEIAKSYSGTHVLQTILDKITSKEIEELILSSIKGYEMELAFNFNSTHVMQKIIMNIKDINRKELNEIILKNTKDLALNANTIFLLKKFISTITIEENKKKIINIISKYCLKIAQNAYGNYAIQYILEIWSSQDNEKINKRIINSVNILSKQKYSSNVIEKAIEFFDEENRDKLINNLCFCEDAISLIKNKYGHFVFNRAIKYMSQDFKAKLSIKLQNDMVNLSTKEKSKIRKYLNSLENTNAQK